MTDMGVACSPPRPVPYTIRILQASRLRFLLFIAL